MSRPIKPLELNAEQQAVLQKLVKAHTTPASLVLRAKIVQLTWEGKGPEEIAALLNTTEKTVHKWKNRFSKEGVNGLHDRYRSGQPRKLSPEKAKEILDATVHKKPEGKTHWSLASMAEYAGVTRWQVEQVWKAGNLKPHRIQTFKISQDPLFAEKVVDIVGLYLNPPDHALVLSVDEKTQIQALERTQPLLPLKPGKIERRTHDYKRHGTASLYAAMNLSNGHIIESITEKHRAIEFIDFLRKINRETPQHLDLHLIVDNSSTHKTQEVRQWLEKHPRFYLHFTPTSASWINAVEGWFAKLERQALYRGVFVSVKELEQAIKAYVCVNNQKNQPFRWTKTAQAILETQKQLKETTNQMTH